MKAAAATTIPPTLPQARAAARRCLGSPPSAYFGPLPIPAPDASQSRFLCHAAGASQQQQPRGAFKRRLARRHQRSLNPPPYPRPGRRRRVCARPLRPRPANASPLRWQRHELPAPSYQSPTPPGAGARPLPTTAGRRGPTCPCIAGARHEPTQPTSRKPLGPAAQGGRPAGRQIRYGRGKAVGVAKEALAPPRATAGARADQWGQLNGCWAGEGAAGSVAGHRSSRRRWRRPKT